MLEASSNLEQISLHIAEDNPEAALRVAAELFDRIERLAAFPNSGRRGREQVRASWCSLRCRTLRFTR